jgi:Acetyltransferase (GNAT) domain
MDRPGPCTESSIRGFWPGPKPIGHDLFDPIPPDSDPAPKIETAPEQAWLTGAGRHGVQHWLENAHGRIAPLSLGGHIAPLVISDDGPQISYVCSPLSSWVRYPIHEVAQDLGPLPSAGLTLAGSLLGGLMRQASLHRPAYINNWLVSTNLHPQVSDQDWAQARDQAIGLAPDRPIIIRSICAQVDAKAARDLSDLGFVLIPARLVYLCDPQADQINDRNHVKRDRKLLERRDVDIIRPDQLTKADVPQLRQCFREIFLDKHSPLNPDFTDAFFNLCLDHQFLELFALRYEGRLVGVVGIMERHGFVTTPLIGYDQSLPQSLGLYRRLTAILIEQAMSRRCKIHYSSGAGSFKSARGGKPELEYTAVFARHLPPYRQAALGLFAQLVGRFGEKLIRQHG